MKKTLMLWTWGILSFFAALILGVIDWLTGFELNFFVFYFLPVSLAAWFLGTIGAVALALVCSMVWFVADHLTGHSYSSSIHIVWNTFIRFISFLAIGWPVARLRYLLDRERMSAEALRRSLSEIKVLETFLPICAQCKKIRDKQGVWKHLESYISEHTDTQFSHGYCPECYRKAMEEAGLLKK